MEKGVFYFLLLPLFFAVSSSVLTVLGSAPKNVTDRIEERAFVATGLSKFNTFLKNSPYTSGMSDFGSALLTGIGKQVDLMKDMESKPAGQLAKEMADNIIPIVSLALAIVPGFGPVLGGLFSGIWGLASSFIGAPQVESPLEKLAKQMDKEFTKIRAEIREAQKETISIADKRTEEKLRSLLRQTFEGQIARNQYICGKYSEVSDMMGKSIRETQNISEALRLEVLFHMNDCDNFLKDSAEGMTHHAKYADVLWIPSVITAIARVAFLEEITTNGKILRIKKIQLYSFWLELKNEIKQQFKYYGQYVYSRLPTAVYQHGDESFYPRLSDDEFRFCEIQKKFLYLDREVYPYGAPEIVKMNQSFHLRMNELNITNDKPHPIQVYYQSDYGDEFDWDDDKETLEQYEARIKPLEPDQWFTGITNCFTAGPTDLTAPMYSFKMKVTFLTNRSYSIRLLYLTIDDFNFINVKNLNQHSTLRKPNSGIGKISRRFDLKHEGKTIRVVGSKRAPNTKLSRFELPTAAFQDRLRYIETSSTGVVYKNNVLDPIRGSFTGETVEPFTIASDNGEKTQDYAVSFDYPKELYMMFLGFEFVVFPNII